MPNFFEVVVTLPSPLNPDVGKYHEGPKVEELSLVWTRGNTKSVDVKNPLCLEYRN